MRPGHRPRRVVPPLILPDAPTTDELVAVARQMNRETTAMMATYVVPGAPDATTAGGVTRPAPPRPATGGATDTTDADLFCGLIASKRSRESVSGKKGRNPLHLLHGGGR